MGDKRTDEQIKKALEAEEAERARKAKETEELATNRIIGEVAGEAWVKTPPEGVNLFQGDELPALGVDKPTTASKNRERAIDPFAYKTLLAGEQEPSAWDDRNAMVMQPDTPINPQQ